MHWWQVDWLLFPRSVLTPAFGSELGQLGSDSAAIMAIPIMDPAIIHMDTTDHIPTMATILGRHTTGITGIATTTATTIIINNTIELM